MKLAGAKDLLVGEEHVAQFGLVRFEPSLWAESRGVLTKDLLVMVHGVGGIADAGSFWQEKLVVVDLNSVATRRYIAGENVGHRWIKTQCLADDSLQVGKLFGLRERDYTLSGSRGDLITDSIVQFSLQLSICTRVGHDVKQCYAYSSSGRVGPCDNLFQGLGSELMTRQAVANKRCKHIRSLIGRISNTLVDKSKAGGHHLAKAIAISG